MAMVEGALDRIRTGTFGQCISCGEEINTERLEAVPWTRFCINCQEKMERGQLENAGLLLRVHETKTPPRRRRFRFCWERLLGLFGRLLRVVLWLLLLRRRLLLWGRLLLSGRRGSRLL